MNRDMLLTSFLPILYLVLSWPIFLSIYNTSTEVIDEEFHLRQGKHYCLGRFDVWDEKITTLPGLYIASAIFSPMKVCTTFYLRSISLVFSAINAFILAKIKQNGEGNMLALLEALNLALLPPLYFFAHLYYTDTLSATTVLGTYYFWLKNRHHLAGVLGLFSVLMRQTNIVWVSMVFGISLLKMIPLTKRKLSSAYNMNPSSMVCGNLQLLIKIVMSILKELWIYALLQCLFIIFVFCNGSIVVGDKSAHVATLHIPQIFYFCIFVLFFGSCFVLPKSLEVLSFLRKRWILTTVLILVGLVVVKYNTIVHPYLLADNRHYTFYIWNRFYGRFPAFKYLMVPLYIFVIVAVQFNLKKSLIEFKIMYIVSLVTVLCFQGLLEIRYFILPYLLLRIQIRLHPLFLVIEFIYYVIINAITFNVFFNKEILWDGNESVHRLIW